MQNQSLIRIFNFVEAFASDIELNCLCLLKLPTLQNVDLIWTSVFCAAVLKVFLLPMPMTLFGLETVVCLYPTCQSTFSTIWGKLLGNSVRLMINDNLNIQIQSSRPSVTVQCYLAASGGVSFHTGTAVALRRYFWRWATTTISTTTRTTITTTT